MEIRFETVLPGKPFSIAKDCDDCNRECDGQALEIANPAHIATPYTCTFQQAPELYKQACGNGYYVVCHPTGTGRIAVLDKDALDLLERFRYPLALASLYMEEASPGQASAAVMLFYALGFLEDLTHTTALSVQEKPQTLSAWLHITNACNLHCAYCYVDKSPESMTDDTSRKAIDAIFRSAIKHQFKKVHLRYAGGEASLQSERIIAVHDYASALAQQYNRELHASLLSNGVFLAPRTIDRFKDRHIGIMISLDGVGAYHDQQRPFINGRGSFQFVDRTITQLLAKKLIPHISVTISQRNLAGLAELMTYILERDMPFSLNYYRENDCSTSVHGLQFSEEQMIAAMRSVFALIERDLPQRTLLNSLIDKANLQSSHARTCGVGYNYLAIDQKGGIAKCHVDIKQTIATIAMDDPLAVIRGDRTGVQGQNVNEKEGCRSCSWRYWCTGGCPLLTYRATGRSDVKSPNCNIYQALFPDVLRLEALRLLQYVPPYQLLPSQKVGAKLGGDSFYALGSKNVYT